MANLAASPLVLGGSCRGRLLGFRLFPSQLVWLRQVVYRASNWHHLRQTQVHGAIGAVPAKTPKAIFVYPLQRDWQAILLAPKCPARSR